MRPDPALRMWRDERTVAEHIPLTHLNEPSVFETVKGETGRIIGCTGFDFETIVHENVSARQRLFRHLITGLGSEFRISVYTVRQRESVQLTGTFPDFFTRQASERYFAGPAGQGMYRNRIFIVLLHKGPVLTKGPARLRGARKSKVEAWLDHFRLQAVKRLKKAVRECMSLLGDAGPRLLGENDEACGYSQVLAFFGLLVTGRWQRYRFASGPAGVFRTHQQMQQHLSRYPHGNLAGVIADRRIFFGQCVQTGEHDPLFARLATITSYPAGTHPLMLEKLLHAEAEFIIAHHFCIEENAVALEKITRHGRRQRNTGSHARSLTQDYLGHRDPKHTARYTRTAGSRFERLWE